MNDKFIEQIHLHNFKGFRERKISGLQKGINIFVGDNETGKSTVLNAIDLVLSANTSRVEAIGLDRLMNQGAVKDFLQKSDRTFADLPCLEVDLYFNDFKQFEFEGEQNLDQQSAHGVYLRCRPKDDLKDEINELVALENASFPYEYYMVEIKSFGGKTLTPFGKPVRHLEIDNTKISNDYASKSYVQSLFRNYVSDKEKNQLKYGYRKAKEGFAKGGFKEINETVEEDFGFTVKSNSKANLETDLTIARSEIDIENLGVGEQCFIRTKFALMKKTNLDVVLLEEPENHLSHKRMLNLIEEIREASQSQIFVATHSSLVCSRLDLRNAVLFGGFDCDPLRFSDLPTETAEFFMKAPSNAVLEFVLSDRNLLVEGDAEFILMDSLYRQTTGKELKNSSIGVISIGGISFPRYLDLAKVLGTKTAVITDNDKNTQGMCVDRYLDYNEDRIGIFYDPDEKRHTFEVCIYQDNTDICEELFSKGRRTLSVQEFMLKNKSHVAFELYRKKADDIVVPTYISDAIEWLNE